ncbi:hypothetical protein OS493_037559 [Desmophyllum pertusum]|uniref:Uncharacterized protein n=1 Tax=Desmophyllum pertusum TaxID=174260 RepID=A0A9W9Z6G5_9CNID|nr:hypothetical protein OS493_037559 [Desmophyllum pertusum]
MCVLSRGDQEKHFCNYGKPEHKIIEVVRFTFTNDDLYFVYLSVDSLRALSLQTGTIFTSVSGCNLYYFTRERQVGYLFRSGTEEIAILLSSLFSPFKFFPVSRAKPSVVGKSIAAVFRSSDTVISVSSDSMVTLWKTAEDKEGITFISQYSITTAGQQVLHVKNCVFSPDGKLMAIHQGTKVQMYSFAESGLKTEFLYTVFEAKCKLLVACFTFSADSTSLLLCIQDSGNDQHFYVWDVQEKVMSASFKSPAFLTVECFCCLSSSTRELILCGEYEIEIWEYTKPSEPSCRLLTRLGVERPYNSVTFSQCTISLDNQLLVCCIANTILVYSVHDPDVNSSKRVLRGHLGRIEFCRFLKGEREKRKREGSREKKIEKGGRGRKRKKRGNEEKRGRKRKRGQRKGRGKKIRRGGRRREEGEKSEGGEKGKGKKRRGRENGGGTKRKEGKKRRDEGAEGGEVRKGEEKEKEGKKKGGRTK